MAERFSEEAFKEAIKEWKSFVEELVTIQPMTVHDGLFSLRVRYSKHWRYDDAMKIIKDNL